MEIFGSFGSDADTERDLELTNYVTPKSTKKWPKDVEDQLKAIEKNCSRLAQMNREEFLRLSQLIKYFKIPIIFFSGINSIFSLMLSCYISQTSASIVSCIISFIVSLIQLIQQKVN